MPQPRTIRLIRILLLAFVGVSLVVVLRQLGTSATPKTPESAGLGAGEGQAEQDRRFELTQSDQGRRLYTVSGARAEQEGDVAEVPDFHLTLYREDDREIQIAGDRALIDVRRHEGTLTGSVKVRGENGLLLESELLRVLAGGDVLDSPVPVRFRYGARWPMEGRADRLRSKLADHELAMAGDVYIEGPRASGGTLKLSAGRVFFQEGDRRLQLDHKVQVELGDGSLSANKVVLHLSPQGDAIEYLRARWNVVADWRYFDQNGGAQRLLADAAELSMLLDPESQKPRKLELEGIGRKPAWLSTESETGEVLRLTARYLQADLEDGRALQALALGGAELWQAFSAIPDEPWRLACAGRIAARFGVGSELRELELEDGVEMHEPGLQVIGDHAISSVFRDTLETTGSPATLLTERGELLAPSLLLQRASGSLHAKGGVKATLAGAAALDGSPLGRGEGPIRVESAEAIWTQDQGSFLFREQVQAWRGDSVLQADQLRGDDLRQELSAAGEVKTRWRQGGDGQEGAAEQVTVTARLLFFRQQENRLIYQENVLVESGGHRIRCQELTVLLDDTGVARSMVCDRDVVIVELERGRRATGDRAEYDLASRVVVLSGEPVTLVEKGGGQMEGRRLQFDLASGRARMLSQGTPGSGAQ